MEIKLIKFNINSITESKHYAQWSATDTVISVLYTRIQQFPDRTSSRNRKERLRHVKLRRKRKLTYHTDERNVMCCRQKLI